MNECLLCTNGWKDLMYSRKIQKGEKFRVLEGRSMIVVGKMLGDQAREASWEQTIKHQRLGIWIIPSKQRGANRNIYE